MVVITVFKCSECGKEFEGRNDQEAFKKLKKHRKEKHMKDTKKDDLSYIT